MNDRDWDLLCRVIAAFFGDGYHVASHSTETQTERETSPTDWSGRVPDGVTRRICDTDHVKIEVWLKKPGKWQNAPSED